MCRNELYICIFVKILIVLQQNFWPLSVQTYILKICDSIGMILAKPNQQISVLQINGERIITTLNILRYLSDSRHLKSRYTHVTMELLKTEYEFHTTHKSGYQNLIIVKTSTISRWFNGSFSYYLTNILDNRLKTDVPDDGHCWTCTRFQLNWPERQALLTGTASLIQLNKWNCKTQLCFQPI